MRSKSCFSLQPSSSRSFQVFDFEIAFEGDGADDGFRPYFQLDFHSVIEDIYFGFDMVVLFCKVFQIAVEVCLVEAIAFCCVEDVEHFLRAVGGCVGFVDKEDFDFFDHELFIVCHFSW